MLELAPFMTDIIIIIIFIKVLKYLLYKTIDRCFRVKRYAEMIKLPAAIMIIIGIMLMPKMSLQTGSYTMTQEPINDFDGFVYEPNRANQKAAVELLKALKKYPDTMKHLDIIHGYTTNYISQNNRSNIESAKIVRLFYTDDTSRCISKKDYYSYVGSDRLFDSLKESNGVCLGSKKISSKEASHYQYAPPMINATRNQSVSYFFPFMHTIMTTVHSVIPVSRKEYAVKNREHKASLMQYQSLVVKFGIFQKLFGKEIRVSDDILLETFIKAVKKSPTKLSKIKA